MKALFGKGIWSVVNLLVVLMVLGGIAIEFYPYVGPGSPGIPAIGEFKREILPVNATSVEDKLSRPADRPVMLMLYASWCSICRTLMPKLADLLRDPAASGHIQPVFISIDEEPLHMSEYLLRGGYAGLFKPYRLVPDIDRTLAEVLQARGATYTRGVPYIALFDRNGALLAEAAGDLSPAELRTLMDLAKH